MVAYLALGARLCVLLYLVYILPWTNAGHEVLYKYKPGQNDLKPEDLAIIQFDSRPLDSYWNTSARWNKAYSEKWGHQYYYLSNKGNCRFGPHLLAEPWCKVKAMVVANKHEKLKRAKAFLFLDSDVVITVNYSMTSAIGYIQRDLHWNATEKPVALNQDGPGWSCKFTLNLGYSLCLNSGTVFWMRSQAATDILEDWWLSSGEQYKVRNKFPSKWRVKVSVTFSRVNIATYIRNYHNALATAIIGCQCAMHTFQIHFVCQYLRVFC